MVHAIRSIIGTRRFTNWIGVGGLLVLAILAYQMVILGPFRYDSICDKCGLKRDTTKWKIPFIEVSIDSSSTEISTPLSAALLKNQIVQPHTHNWLFAVGGGNGVKCAIGSGRHLLPVVESKEFVTLIENLHKSGETALVKRVLAGGLNPDTTREFCHLSDGLEPYWTGNGLRMCVEEQLAFMDEMKRGDK